MKKTLTMSLALVGIAGLAVANIETAPAGYIEKTTGTNGMILVTNPFGSFTGNTPTLGDLDGSALAANDYVKIISVKGKTLFTATYGTKNDVTGWYDGNGCSNAFPLPRGTSIQFYSPNNDGTLSIAGMYTGAGETLTLAAGHNFVGNASPKQVLLQDIVPSSFAPLNGEYAMVWNTKVVYVPAAIAAKINKTAGWYLHSAINGNNPAGAVRLSEAWFIPAGEGFRIYAKKSAGQTITLPGLDPSNN